MKFLLLIAMLAIFCIFEPIESKMSLKKMEKELKKLKKQLNKVALKKDLEDDLKKVATKKDLKKKADKTALDQTKKQISVIKDKVEDNEYDINYNYDYIGKNWNDIQEITDDIYDINDRMTNTTDDVEFVKWLVEQNSDNINDIQDAIGVLNPNCPESYPYAFYLGSNCCKTDITCDNETMTRCSTCCLHDDYIQCPEGDDCYDIGTTRPNDCCQVVNLKFQDGGEWDGDYIKNDSLLHFRAYWIHSSGWYAIWHYNMNDTDYGWLIGESSALGNSKDSDGVYGWAPSNARCLSEIDTPWNQKWGEEAEWGPEENYVEISCYHTSRSLSKGYQCNPCKFYNEDEDDTGDNYDRAGKFLVGWSKNNDLVQAFRKAHVDDRNAVYSAKGATPNVLDSYNMAHVISRDQIAAILSHAKDGWSGHSHDFLYHKALQQFINWHFEIDLEAGVWNGHKKDLINFRDYLLSGEMANASNTLVDENNKLWTKALALIWNGALYGGAGGFETNFDSFHKELKQLLDEAPANIRIGDSCTNGLVSNYIDPMFRWKKDANGDFVKPYVNEGPTTKECEVMENVRRQDGHLTGLFAGPGNQPVNGFGVLPNSVPGVNYVYSSTGQLGPNDMEGTAYGTPGYYEINDGYTSCTTRTVGGTIGVARPPWYTFLGPNTKQYAAPKAPADPAVKWPPPYK